MSDNARPDNVLFVGVHLMNKLLSCMFQFAPELHTYEYFSEWLTVYLFVIHDDRQ